MEKRVGMSGFKLVAFAMVAYVLALTGQHLALLLLLGFSIVYERSEWLAFQVGQVLALRLIYDGILNLWRFIYNAIHNDFFDLFETRHETYRSFSDFNDTFQNILLYVFMILLIIGFVKLLKSPEPKIPFIGKLLTQLKK